MMNTQQAKEKLLAMIRARCPIIGIETVETRRFIEGLVDIVDTDEEQQRQARRSAQRKEIFTFSVSRGLHQLATFTGELGNGSLIYEEQRLTDSGPDPAFSAFEVAMAILENDKPRLLTDGSPDPDSNKPRIYIMKDVHDYFGNPLFVRALRDLSEALTKRRQTIILVSPSLAKMPQVLRKDVRTMAWPLPGREEIQAQVEDFCTSITAAHGDQMVSDSLDVDGLVDSLAGLTCVEADQVLAEAVISLGVLDERAATFAISAKAEIIKQSGALEFYPPEVGLDQVGGLDNLKNWLIAAGRSNTPEAKAFGMKPARGALVVGVPGCGKSLTAKAMASLWGVPLLRLDIGALFGSLVGESESQTRNAWRVASAVGRCILWIDEIEKGLASQGGERDGGTSKRVFGTLLTLMEEKSNGIFLYATANEVQALRPELVRRFTEVFFVDLPQPQERQTILEIHLAKTGREPSNYDLGQVVQSTDQFTGSELEEVVQGGLWRAFAAKRELDSSDLVHAALETVPLSRTMAEGIAHMRKWATRARPASSAQAHTANATGAQSRAQALEL